MPDKTDPKQINVEIDMVTTDVHGIQVITIPFDMYNSLIELKGRYEEIKDGEEDNNNFMKEYQELLIIKGKYEELSKIFEKIIIDKPNTHHGPICRTLPNDGLIRTEHIKAKGVQEHEISN